MAPATKEELTEAAEAGAEAALKKRDSNPPHKSGEMPAIPAPVPAPAPVDATITKSTRFTLEVVAMIISVVVAIGGLFLTQRALADDLKTVKAEVDKKADKAAAEEREKRLRELEKFVAAQAELNKSQAEANKQNEKQHEVLGSKLDKILEKVSK